MASLDKTSADILQADTEAGCPHPREVYSIIGHGEEEKKLARLFANNELHHAWLISGTKGIGKATLAYRLVRTVLGGNPDTNGRLDVPQNDAVAQRVQSLGHGDFLLIRRPYDEKSKKLRTEIPISEARKISEFFSKKASEGGWRICLVDNMDEMNKNAANAVLKILEEPPEKCLLILLSNSPGRLLPTIRSRCMSLHLRPISDKDLMLWLADKQQADAEDIEAAIKLSSGAPGKAFAYLQSRDIVLKPLKIFIDSFPKSNTAIAHRLSDQLAGISQDKAYDLFWEALMINLQKQAIYSATADWEGAYKPIALAKPVEEWTRIRSELINLRSARSGLNMNKKQILLQALLNIGARYAG